MTRCKGTGNIIRYPNRRLYDSDSGAYITIEDVETQVKAGKRVRIVTRYGNEDITGYVLLNILAKHAQEGNNRVTDETLFALIKTPEPGAQAATAELK